MSLTVPVHDLYAENHKMVMKQIKEDLNKWRNTLYSWTERLNIIKILNLKN